MTWAWTIRIWALFSDLKVRFGVLALLCALAFVLYLDRVCISQAAQSIQDDLGLDNTHMGFVFRSQGTLRRVSPSLRPGVCALPGSRLYQSGGPVHSG